MIFSQVVSLILKQINSGKPNTANIISNIYQGKLLNKTFKIK